MISIAMTTYNGELFLRQQIDSILNQTYSNFELIICDDCSSDNTRIILNEYEKKDNRIKVIYNSKNLGFIKNFDKAINLCTGEYIAFSDQDDIWKEEHLEILLKNIKDDYMICSDSLLFNDNLTIGSMKETLTLDFIPMKQDMFYYLLFNNFVQGSTSLVKRELINYVGHLYDTTAFFHDHWFALYAAYFNKLSYVDEQLIYYRQHDKNVTVNLKKSFLNLLKKKSNNNKVLGRGDLLCHFSLTEDSLKNQMISEAINFYKQNSFSERFLSIIYLFKHYKKMYSVESYRFFFARMIKLLLRK